MSLTTTETAGEEKTTYKGAIEALLTALRTANEERQRNLTALNELRRDYDALEGQRDASVTVARENVATETGARNTREAELDQTEAAHVARVQQLEADLNAKNAEIARVQQELTAQIEALRKQNDVLTAINQQQADELAALRNESFDVADGEIRWVDHRSRTVWINLGRADSLPLNMTFSVWGQDANGVNRGAPKATIEVSQVADDHLGQARIVVDDAANPILPGDVISTPLWHPGRTLHVALAGEFPRDADGNSTRELVRQLVAISGGTIDAEVAEDGQVTGELSIETRYLIWGGEPLGDPEQVAPHSSLRAQADRFGVQILNLEKFLDYVGYGGTLEGVRYGLGSDPNDFLDRDGEQRVSGGTTSGLFRERRPPASAYDQ
jgi:hypothetical protein